MSQYPEHVMVALFPTTGYWTELELPHMTLVYAGEISDLNFTDQTELAKLALDFSLRYPPQILTVADLEVFGEPPKEVDVFTVIPSEDVLDMRDELELWDVSEHSFNPHVTIGPRGTFQGLRPQTLTFTSIAVCWGDNRTVYALVGKDPQTVEVLNAN
jgi:2'-5' RNA ligase